MLLVPWLLMLAGLGTHAWVARSRHFEALVAALPSSYWLQISFLMWDANSYRGRFHITTMVSGVIFWPIKNLHIRKNKLDPADIANFPKNLRTTLLLANSLFWSGGVLAVVANFM